MLTLPWILFTQRLNFLWSLFFNVLNQPLPLVLIANSTAPPRILHNIEYCCVWNTAVSRILMCLGKRNFLLWLLCLNVYLGFCVFVYLWLLCIWWSGVPELVNCALRCFVPTKRTLWCSLSATKHWKSHLYRAAPGSFNHNFRTFLQSENKFKQTVGCKILILYLHFYILLTSKNVYSTLYCSVYIQIDQLYITYCTLYSVHCIMYMYTLYNIHRVDKHEWGRSWQKNGSDSCTVVDPPLNRNFDSDQLRWDEC